jgi:ribosomal-protein-alanine N-acetyltransferase
MSTFNSYRIRDLDDNFMSEVIQLDLVGFPLPWSQSSWNHLDFKLHHLTAFTKDGIFVGFSLVSLPAGDSVAHLQKICLSKACRGQGMSKVFWSQLVDYYKDQGATSIYLEVQKSNSVAISFYQNVGFQTLRVAKNYYSNGDDALIMQLML